MAFDESAPSKVVSFILFSILGADHNDGNVKSTNTKNQYIIANVQSHRPGCLREIKQNKKLYEPENHSNCTKPLIAN